MSLLIVETSSTAIAYYMLFPISRLKKLQVYKNDTILYFINYDFLILLSFAKN